MKGPPEGIKVHMNDEDITDIQATITGPGKCLCYLLTTPINILFLHFVSYMYVLTKHVCFLHYPLFAGIDCYFLSDNYER